MPNDLMHLLRLPNGQIGANTHNIFSKSTTSHMRVSLIHRTFTQLVLLAMLLLGVAKAQGTAHVVSFSKFTVKEGYKQESDGVTGLLLQFDVAFNWLEDDYYKRSFQLSYRVLHNGNELLRSTDEGLSAPNMTAMSQSVKGKPGMVVAAQQVMIPYRAIPLESGPQSVEIVFSLANNTATYTDCYKATVNFTHKKIVRRDLNAQVFTFSNVVLDKTAKEFSTGNAAMEIKAHVDFKYGPEESLNDKYEMYWLLRNLSGKVVFDSRKNTSASDQTVTLPNALIDGKASAKLSMIGSYYNIDLDGPQEAEVVIVLNGTEGGPKEIFTQKMMLNVPPKYNFEAQEFVLNGVKAAPSQRDGVGGIEVNYSCAFKQTGTLRNPEKGKYFFYAAIFDAAGKVVIAPERAPTKGSGSTHLQDGHLPALDHAVAAGSLFIPYHMLTVAAGNHNLKFMLMVSDVNLQTKFPPISNGTVAITKPADVHYRLSLERLEMIHANYDSDIAGLSSPLPELQYLFAVGEDNYFASEYDRNSLTAIPGAATLHLCEGDPINLLLYDIDSGFFNESDLQGQWKIDYAGKGDSFTYSLDNAGQVVALRLKVTKVAGM
jgi:hypothetical protein